MSVLKDLKGVGQWEFVAVNEFVQVIQKINLSGVSERISSAQVSEIYG
jgi:hypothetical protein